MSIANQLSPTCALEAIHLSQLAMRHNTGNDSNKTNNDNNRSPASSIDSKNNSSSKKDNTSKNCNDGTNHSINSNSKNSPYLTAP